MHLEEPPPDSSISGLLIIAIILIILSMIFSASESAFLSVNKLRIRFLRRKKNKKAIRTGKLLDKKDQLINTILIGNNIVNIALSSILASIAYKLFGTTGVAIATIVTTIVLLIFGEITPKSLGACIPEKIAFIVTPFISFCTIILKPLSSLFTLFPRFLTRIIGIRIGEKKASFSQEDIKTFMEVGEEEGVLDSGEKTMMHRVFKFTDLDAKDIMQPRTSMVVIPLVSTYSRVIELSQKSHKSRIPVYGENIDDIKGVLYMKDVLSYANHKQDFKIQNVMRKPLYIPESMNMTAIQQILRDNNQTIAVVLDEYSGTAGLLTTEDISQEIFGSMFDEYDISQTPEIIKNGDNYIVGGITRLNDLSEGTGIFLSSDYSETIGGYTCEKLGRIPVVGDFFIDKGKRFTVKEIASQRVVKILIEEEKR